MEEDIVDEELVPIELSKIFITLTGYQSWNEKSIGHYDEQILKGWMILEDIVLYWINKGFSIGYSIESKFNSIVEYKT